MTQGTVLPKRQPAWPATNRRPVKREGKLRRLTTATASLVVAVAAIVMLGRVLRVSDADDLGLRSDASASVAEEVVRTQPDTFAGERKATSRGFSEASDRFDREEGMKEVAVAVVGYAEHLANGSDATLARAATERELEETYQKLARERDTREQAQRGAQEVRERLSLAERANEAVQQQLAAEHNARLKAEIATQQATQQLAKEHGAKEAAQRALKESHKATTKHAAARTSVDVRGLLLSPSPN